MTDPLAGLPPGFVRTLEAARFLGLSGRTLEKHRARGSGPKYSKVGGRVIYAIDDLKTWAELRAKRGGSRRRSTAERSCASFTRHASSAGGSSRRLH
jgi:hypothetical protein